MVSLNEVQAQLKRIGADFRYWGRGEAAELQHILVPGETIHHALNGRYEGGFAMLVATDLRVLLIDKKPFYLTLEDIRYDMVSEVDYSHRLIDATIRVCSFNKVVRFTSFKHRNLRALTMYVQLRVMEWRQHGGYQPDGFREAISNTQAAASSPEAEVFGQPSTEVSYIKTPLDGGHIGRLATLGGMRHWTNPYTRTPLIMRRRVSRFYQSQ